MYGRFQLFANRVQMEATVPVNLLVPHVVHRKPLALPNANTTFWQLLATAIHATVLSYIWTRDTCYTLYFIDITLYM